MSRYTDDIDIRISKIDEFAFDWSKIEPDSIKHLLIHRGCLLVEKARAEDQPKAERPS